MQQKQTMADSLSFSVSERKTTPKWSIKKAILTGHLLLTLPSFLLFIIPVLIAILQMNHDEISYGILIPGILTGLVLSWYYWSFMVTRWKIMAFSRVKNKKALRNHAIRSFILFKEGSLAERTEQKSFKQKKQLIEIYGKHIKTERKKILPGNLMKNSLNEVHIYFSKNINLIEFGFTILTLLIGIVFIYVNYLYLGLCFTGIGILGILYEYRQLINKLPQITLNQNGIESEDLGFIQWGDVFEVEISEKAHAKAPYEALKIVHRNQKGEKETDWIELTELNMDNESLSYLIDEYKNLNSDK